MLVTLVTSTEKLLPLGRSKFTNINSCLDTLIGIPKETIVKSFGTPSHITTQYVEVAVAENDRYYAHMVI